MRRATANADCVAATMGPGLAFQTRIAARIRQTVNADISVMAHLIRGPLLLATLMVAAHPVVAADTATPRTEAEEVALVGDVAAGKKRYRRECRQCHGPKGKGLSSYPQLVGHPTDYLVEMLERYRAGEKIGPNTPLMAPRAKKLKDKDIADLAAFIVSLEET